MTRLRLGLVALLLPAVAPGQGAPRAPAAPAVPPPYRGFAPGISYRAFVERARALAYSDVVRCQTSQRTAQLMDAGVVAFYDSAGFGNARGVPLLDRTKRDLTRVFRRPRPIGRSGWEWRYAA